MTGGASSSRLLGARPGRSSGRATRSKRKGEDEKQNRSRQGGCVDLLSTEHRQQPRRHKQDSHYREKDLGNSGCHTPPGTGAPNGSRLSCGALKKDSFLNLRAPAASSACLGGRPAAFTAPSPYASRAPFVLLQLTLPFLPIRRRGPRHRQCLLHQLDRRCKISAAG